MMEDLNGKISVFKKVDQAVFDRLDKFKLSPNYHSLQEFYNGLEEEQQKALKGGVILALILAPIFCIGILWLQNSNLKSDLEMRISIVAKANEILGLNRGIADISPRILAQNPIDSDSMMTSRLSTMLSSAGVDISKIKVKDFNSSSITSDVLRSEADFSFNGASTEELMNIFSAMIQKEKFRISDIKITRNAQNNLLQGQFHAIHFSAVGAPEEE